AAVVDYRAARDAWEALRESGQPAPSSVPGVAGSLVAMHQLEDEDFRAAHPAPRFTTFLAEHAARQRRAEQVDHDCLAEVDLEPEVRRCGRLDDHPLHDWTCPVCKVTYRCTGHVVIEASARRRSSGRSPSRPREAP